jgi:type I restriction enzyme M protein
MARADKKTRTKTLEQRLWEIADALRGNQEPSEYKHVVLGLVFLKYISDRFEARRSAIVTSLSDPNSNDYIPNESRRAQFVENREEYASHNVFWVPLDARWKTIQNRAKLPSIGQDIDAAMDVIEKENPAIRGVLPRNYGRDGLDKGRLGQLVDMIGSIGFTESDDHGSDDVLGRVYEYFLGQFAGKETGRDAGAFYTPRSVVKTLVEMLEPYHGRVYDPACGSGGMFVQSAEFVKVHGGKRTDISVYGQEFTDTTWRLARMNLALRGIEANLGDKSADTFTNDLHPDLRVDFAIANPPFNVSNWWDAKLADDPRWKYGTPPEGNANFAWAQHLIYHLKASGRAGFVLANMSLASDDAAERKIRRGMIEDNLVDCIVTLPDKLFINTPISVSLWFIDRARTQRGVTDVLFIDATRANVATSRTSNTVTDETIEELSRLYHDWRADDTIGDHHASVKCATASADEIEQNGWILLPASYIDHSASEDVTVSTIAEAIEGQPLLSAIKAMEELEGRAASLRSTLRSLLSRVDVDVVTCKLVRIGDLVEASKEVLGDTLEPEVLTCTEGAGLILQRERFAKRIATEDTSKYKIVRRGDIVYNPYLLWKGSIDQCLIVDEGITSPAYEVFRVRDGFDPVIVGKLLTSPEIIRRYDGISFGTIQRRRRAAPSNFLELKVDYPIGGVAEELASILSELRRLQFLGREIERGFREAVTDAYEGLIAVASSSAKLEGS